MLVIAQMDEASEGSDLLDCLASVQLCQLNTGRTNDHGLSRVVKMRSSHCNTGTLKGRVGNPSSRCPPTCSVTPHPPRLLTQRVLVDGDHFAIGQDGQCFVADGRHVTPDQQRCLHDRPAADPDRIPFSASVDYMQSWIAGLDLVWRWPTPGGP